MELTTDDLIQQNRLRTAQPLLDTSFGAAVRQSMGVNEDDDLSISQYLNEDKIRERNAALDTLIKDEFLPLDIQNDFNKKYYSVGQTSAYYDAVANYLNTIPEKDRPKPPSGESEWKTQLQIMSPIWEEMEGRRRGLGQTLEQGDWRTWAGMFTGGMLMSTADPVNLAAMFLTSGFSVVGRGIQAGKTVRNVEQALEATRRLQNLSRLKEAVKFGGVEAMVNVAAESTVMMQNSAWRDASGNPYTPEQVILGLGGAAVIGGGFGAVAGGVSTHRLINKANIAMGKYEDNVRIFREMLSGVRDSQGRVETPAGTGRTDGTNYETNVVGKANWSQDATAVGVYGEYRTNTDVAFQPQQPPGVGNALRIPEPPPIKKGQSQIPLDAYTRDLFMAFDTQAFTRLANRQLMYSTDTPARDRFDLFSTTGQADAATPNASVQVRFDPSQIVGFIKYAPKGFRQKTTNAWQRGEAHFLVNKESRFEAEGRGDHFLFDTATHINFEIPSLANKYAKVLRQQGFIRDPSRPQTGFIRPQRLSPSAADLTTIINDMTTAMDAFDAGVNVFRGVPEDVKALPANMVIDGIQTASNRFMSPSFLPRGQGVSNFSTRTGVDITAMPARPAGVTPEQTRDVVLPADYVEVENRIRQLSDETEGRTMLQFDESDGQNTRMVPMRETFEQMDVDITATQRALQCILGVAASGE